MAQLLLRRTTNIMKQLYITKSSLTTNQSSFIPSFLGISHNVCSNYSVFSPTSFVFGRLESTKAAELKIDPQLYSSSEDDDDHDHAYPSSEPNEGMDFPGGKVMFTSQMSFIAESGKTRVPCYRVLNDSGELICGKVHDLVNQDLATRMYNSMITLQIMDTFLYEAQRQGRISFYMTSFGEEAINIASAAALSTEDIIFAQYREPGALLWRGFTLQDFTNQCFGNKADCGKGRQMPNHYGSSKHNYFTISSPIATQLPQAAGAAYSLKMDKKDACVVAYMGDGCTSEGDFHAGLNFAAVMEVPIVFICRNNGYAISTPISDQFRSDGVVVKGQAYGIRSFRVDGNDALAVYNVVRTAREMAISEQRPILVEALTYRVGHHSTSDDSTKYRSTNEIEHWKIAKSPVTKFRMWIERIGWWNEDDEMEIRKKIKKEILQAIQVAEKLEKPPVSEMFTDVYDEPTKDLVEQEILLRESIKKHPKDYPSDVAK
ncbi:2-oxoisovalerate dehydrogenase subunit alpha 2, mitochondrial-like [Chenopodium quinoa]|nr:2-oxoisovalerate dehydrogenase subunit alpha 2, mitochondrial-like [Chenopodium quinoa]